MIDKNSEYKYYEIECSIHNVCNLHCPFCSAKRSTVHSLDTSYMKELPYKLAEKVIPELKKSNKDGVRINTWGGELFSDDIPDDWFDLYYNYVMTLKELLSPYTNEVDIKWVTNGIWKNYDRVKKLIHKTNSYLTLSYDPVGRFAENQKKDWLETYNEMYNEIRHICMTMTKPNIKAVLEGKDDIILNTPSDRIVFEYYWANFYHKIYMPSDEELYQFLRWLVINKPLSYPISEFITSTKLGENDSTQRYCNCANIMYYNGYEITKKCFKMSTEQNPEEFYDKEGMEKMSDDTCYYIARNKFERIRNCLTCPFYNRCVQQCYGSAIHKDYKLGICPYKRLYEEFMPND